MVQSSAVRTIADLIVVLNADDELSRRQRRRVGAACVPHVMGMLTDEEPPLLERAGQVGRRPREVGVVAFVIVRGVNPRLVMKIVGPYTIDAEAASLNRLQQRRKIPVILGDEVHRTFRMRANG
jgi:hypothetical protein